MLEESPLCAAVLVDSGLRRIPHRCFDSSANLSLVALSGECAVMGTAAFENCGVLTGIDLEHVEAVKVSAFQGCGRLSHMGAHSRVRSIGGHAFEVVDAVELAFGSVAKIGEGAFAGSSLKAFLGRVDEWGNRPFNPTP
jgi:hypothetical protein